MLDRLPHHAGEACATNCVRSDPETARWSAALKLCGVDREAQGEMGEDLLDFARARHSQGATTGAMPA